MANLISIGPRRRLRLLDGGAERALRIAVGRRRSGVAASVAGARVARVARGVHVRLRNAIVRRPARAVDPLLEVREADAEDDALRAAERHRGSVEGVAPGRDAEPPDLTVGRAAAHRIGQALSLAGSARHPTVRGNHPQGLAQVQPRRLDDHPAARGGDAHARRAVIGVDGLARIGRREICEPLEYVSFRAIAVHVPDEGPVDAADEVDIARDRIHHGRLDEVEDRPLGRLSAGARVEDGSAAAHVRDGPDVMAPVAPVTLESHRALADGQRRDAGRTGERALGRCVAGRQAGRRPARGDPPHALVARSPHRLNGGRPVRHARPPHRGHGLGHTWQRVALPDDARQAPVRAAAEIGAPMTTGERAHEADVAAGRHRRTTEILERLAAGVGRGSLFPDQPDQARVRTPVVLQPQQVLGDHAQVDGEVEELGAEHDPLRQLAERTDRCDRWSLVEAGRDLVDALIAEPLDRHLGVLAHHPHRGRIADLYPEVVVEDHLVAAPEVDLITGDSRAGHGLEHASGAQDHRLHLEIAAPIGGHATIRRHARVGACIDGGVRGGARIARRITRPVAGVAGTREQEQPDEEPLAFRSRHRCMLPD